MTALRRQSADPKQSVHAVNRLSGFGATLAVQTAGGLIQTTGLLATLGPRAWSAISIAQTVGLLGATVVSGGLTSFGASVVATAPDDDRASRTLETLRARCVLYLGVMIVAAGTTWAVTPTASAPAMVVSATALLPGLGASWYFIGTRQPLRWLRLDIVPVTSGTLLGVLVTTVAPVPAAFAACYAAGGLAAVLISRWAVRRDLANGEALPAPIPALAFVRGQRRLLAAGVAGGINGQWPAILMAAVGSPLTPTYLLMDRLTKYAIAGASPVVQFAQGWVPAAGPSRASARARAALAVMTAGAVVAAIAFAWGADKAARLLSHGTIEAGQPEVALFAVLTGLLLLTQVNALAVLVPLGLDRLLALSTAGGAAVLVVAGLAAATVTGLPGIVAVTVLVEGAILATQLGTVLHRTRGRA